MLKSLVKVAVTSATLFVGIASMSITAEARPWHHGHSNYLFMTPVHRSAHCIWRHRWNHGRPLNVRVCRPIYW